MEFTAKTIAEFLNGRIEGDPQTKVHNISKIESGTPGTLSFLANPKYTKYIYSTQASIVLINEDVKLEKEVSPTLIRVKDAYQSFAHLLDMVEKQNKKNQEGIDDLTFVHPTAKIGKNVYIASFTYIGKNVIIGDNVKLNPHVYLGDDTEIKDNTILASGVKVYHNCKIGADCIIHSGVVIGSDGFGFAPDAEKNYKKVPQIGNVIIEDEVEIGANTTIDRATIGSTIIRKGAKLDNLIQIAHNVEIGEHTAIAAQTGISGSTKVGKDCIFAGQVGVIGHLNITDKVTIGAQSGVTKDIVSEGEILLGSPAQNIRDNRKSLVLFRNLPKLKQQIDTLEKEVKRLKELLEEQAHQNND